MKKIIVILIFALFAFLATTAFAQANFTLQADVPFSFSVEGHQYDAGYYQLHSINSTTVRLVNMETGAVSLIRLSFSEQPSIFTIVSPKLRFVVNGESYYLVSLVDGYGNGWQVPPTFKDLRQVLASSRKPS
jgi:hypothetical protein